MIERFAFARTPRIRFGAGETGDLGRHLAPYGTSVLVVTGQNSLDRSGRWEEMANGLREAGLEVRRVRVEGEPSPEWVDQVAAANRAKPPGSVAATGGGSVLDAGKAVSAMILERREVTEFLEDVGTGAELSGRKIPFAAVPTTAGTGSEATKNAVLSRVGRDGFKKSLRHESLIPDLAVVDPTLAVGCPPAVTAACGMDAFTQLLEAYVSTKASPMTDGLVREAIRRAGRSLVPAATTHGDDVGARSDLAYAALVSGIALANAGLGIVHGLASPIGAMFDIPHGVVCGTLVAAATRANVEVLRETDPQGKALRRYADVARLLDARVCDEEAALDNLLAILDDWTRELEIPTLDAYGVTQADVEQIAGSAGRKNNPAPLDVGRASDIVRQRISG